MGGGGFKGQIWDPRTGYSCLTSKLTCRTILVNLWTTLWIISFALGSDVPSLTNFHFTIEPEDSIGYKGKSLYLPCTVVFPDNAPHEYNWYKDGMLIDTTTERRFTVHTNGTLEISDVTDRKSSTDAGTYQCSLTWDGHTILSKASRVQIAGIERSFDIEPVDIEVYLSDTAMFRCQIASIPNANITWYKDDTVIVDRNQKYRTYPEGVLEVYNVEFSDLGKYYCMAEGVDRSRRSNDAKLTQKKAEIENEFQGVEPGFTLKPLDTSAMVGSKVILFCGAYGLGSDMAKPTITWLKDGRTIDLNKDGRVSIIGGGNLQILNVKLASDSNPESDDAMYMCRAENDVDSVDAEAQLTVTSKPFFMIQPQYIYQREKSDVTIPCQAGGEPKPEIYWYKNGEQVITGKYFEIVENENLRILGLLKGDEGFYQCFAVNSAGSIQASMQLEVEQQDSPLPINPSTPSIYYHVHRSGAHSAIAPDDVPSQPTKLIAPLVSTRFITLTWDQPVHVGTSEIVGYTVRWLEVGSERERILNVTAKEASILYLQPNTEYQFLVAAYNKYGATLTPALLKVRTQEEDDVPTEPQNVQVIPLSPVSIRVTWEPPLQTKGSLLQYVLFYYVDGAVEEEEVEIDSTKTEYTLTDLEEYQMYSFRIVAFNANGAGMSTKEAMARTFSDIPTDVPLNFTLETASSTSIVVRWQPPKAEHQNGKITGYKIRYKKKNAKKGFTVTTSMERDLYALTDLKKDTVYLVRISAQTVNGSGPPTEWASAKTYADDLDESQEPDIPDRLVVRPTTNSLVVQWVPNKRSKYLVRGYLLGYGKGIPDVLTKKLDANTFFYTIVDLQPATLYIVSIRAFNNIGPGLRRYETVYTLEEEAVENVTPMLPPIGLKATVLSEQTIILTWTDNSLGKIQRVTDNRYYTIRYTSTPNRGKYKYVNSTDLVKQIDDLRPHTKYEFSVKVYKGRRTSVWSMAVSNVTQEAAPGSIPRDLTAIPVEGDPLSVTLNWQPPQKPHGQITGYLVLYTTDPNKDDDLGWVVEGVYGEKLSMTITDLTADTTYYFKVQARNNKGYGPMSPTKIYKTPKLSEIQSVNHNNKISGGPISNENSGTKEEKGLSQNVMIIIIACIVGATFCIVAAVVTIFMCRRRDMAERNRRMATMYKNSPQKGKGPPPKGPQHGEGRPPDLWIDHDHLDLKNVSKDDRGESSVSVASTRRNSLSSVHTNNQAEIYQSGSEAEERLLPPSYHQLSNTQQRNIIRPKPLKLPVDSQSHQREPVVAVAAYPNGNVMARYNAGTNRPPSPSEDSGVIPMRPVYPRTQYQMQYAAQGPPRVNAGDLANTSCESHGYPAEYGLKPQQTAPPYKKAAPISSGPIKPRAMMAPMVSPKQAPDVLQTSKEEKDIKKSLSTEELTAEMANLEGLMKDLNAITQQDFEC
ncbi:putative aminophospholipid-translocase [Mactra antiquata]